MRKWALAKWHARHERLRRKALTDVGVPQEAPVNINELLHHLRGRELATLPQRARHFVSVGCAGAWYFHWIAERCGPLRHTGIEFYSPRPDDLPAGCDWIANTAGNMEAVADGSADVLFSGQNIEHLWPDDIANFLLESHRVLEPGGLLVVDSPNRRLTHLLNWSHPEHTIELEPQEARELLELAGFDVQREAGIWLCEAPDTREVLAFDEMTAAGRWPIRRRVDEARPQPEHAFIWWTEARRSQRAPRADELRRRIAQIDALAWPERLNRLLTIVGKPIQRDGATWFDSEGREGALVYGPYTALPPGRHEVTLFVEYPEGLDAGHASAFAHVSHGPAGDVITRTTIECPSPGTPIEVKLAFELKDTTFSIQFLVVSSRARLIAKKAVTLRTQPLAA